MPFDPVPVARIATKAEFDAAEPKQRLRMLGYALRHMPATHVWHFGSCYHAPGVDPQTHCGTAGCSAGLASGLWQTNPLVDWDKFGLSIGQCGLLFSCGAYWPTLDHEVTPTMVADAIDRYLATGKP